MSCVASNSRGAVGALEGIRAVKAVQRHVPVERFTTAVARRAGLQREQQHLRDQYVVLGRQEQHRLGRDGAGIELDIESGEGVANSLHTRRFPTSSFRSAISCILEVPHLQDHASAGARGGNRNGAPGRRV